MGEDGKGFRCECGKWHPFGVYVMAHWTTLLLHTCDACGRKHDVLEGVATPKQDDE